MNNISDVLIKPLGESIYTKPITMVFKQNGRPRSWDMVEVHNSVSIILYNITREVLVTVKQFRPAVYYGSIPAEDRTNSIDVSKYPPELGIGLELCAGIADKEISLEEIAREEVLEECGYDVPISNLQRISSYKSGVGSSGSTQTMFYCEVTDAMKVSSGGGVGDEIIDVVELSLNDMKKYISQPNIVSAASFLFGIYWFLHNKTKV